MNFNKPKNLKLSNVQVQWTLKVVKNVHFMGIFC